MHTNKHTHANKQQITNNNKLTFTPFTLTLTLPLTLPLPLYCFPPQVTKRTSLPVKFWLFENYLSPSFKTIAAAMAQEYHFEVAYVTYKWPEWLTQQTQKQRIIWGYKILFLDVLFPLSVKKVSDVATSQPIPPHPVEPEPCRQLNETQRCKLDRQNATQQTQYPLTLIRCSSDHTT